MIYSGYAKNFRDISAFAPAWIYDCGEDVAKKFLASFRNYRLSEEGILYLPASVFGHAQSVYEHAKSEGEACEIHEDYFFVDADWAAKMYPSGAQFVWGFWKSLSDTYRPVINA